MIAEIILKKLCGQLSKKEETLFKKWLSENDENFLTYQRLRELHRNNVLLPDINDINPQEAWEVISTELQKRKPNKINRFSFNGVMRYAAIFVGLAVCYITYNSLQEDDIIKLLPNSTEITLELGNGEIQIISALVNSTKDGLVVKKKNGFLNYSKSENQENDVAILEYNTIRVPNGKTFKVVLFDGTMVNLNSGSSLKFPVKFIKGNNREVSLTGEAFFDVHKNEHSPFIVTTGKMDVRVLGTKFNVSSYPEDTYESTVLVEGSVQVYETGVDYDEDKSTLLYPGYKADWNSTDKNIKVNKVNTELYTGWVDGKLAMRKMKFSTIIQRLQRHYNIEINNTYEALNERVFTATFETESILEVLETFKIETSFEYEINGDKIRIIKPLNSNK